MNPTEQTMLGVVEETFASLAFMFPVEPAAPAACDPETARQAVVEFSGPFRGALLLSASPELLEPLASNMLGLDDGVCPSPEQKQDAFRELLNVICGNLLPAIASPREVFDVHEPRMLGAQDNGGPAGLKDLGAVDVDLDAGHIRLALRIEEPLAGCVATRTGACAADILSASGEAARASNSGNDEDAGVPPATHEGKMPSPHADKMSATHEGGRARA